MTLVRRFLQKTRFERMKLILALPHGQSMFVPGIGRIDAQTDYEIIQDDDDLWTELASQAKECAIGMERVNVTQLTVFRREGALAVAGARKQCSEDDFRMLSKRELKREMLGKDAEETVLLLLAYDADSDASIESRTCCSLSYVLRGLSDSLVLQFALERRSIHRVVAASVREEERSIGERGQKVKLSRAELVESAWKSKRVADGLISLHWGRLQIAPAD
jgi:hypothetical protein